MSLYDGLDIDENEGRKDKPDVSGWGSRSKLLETQKQLQAKKASLINIKKKQNMTVAPVFDLKRRGDDVPLTFNMLTGKMERATGPVVVPAPQIPVPPPAAPFIANEAPGSGSMGPLGFTEEYDPLKPNDYENYVKRRKEQRHKEREDERKKEQEERERRRRERHRERGNFPEDREPPHGNFSEDRGNFDDRGNYDDRPDLEPPRGNYSDEDSDGEDRRRRRRRNDDEDTPNREDRDRDRDRERDRDYDRDRNRDRENGRDKPRTGGAAIAPPMSLIEESQPVEDKNDPNASGEYGSGFNVGKGSVVSRMMAKMGYREGAGLGKSEQGMSTALQVEKTSKRGGKIIHERDIPKEMPRQEVNAWSNANLLKNPTKVILLRNMVGPGEVDEDLEPETAEECGKYGKVLRCIIFEIPKQEEEEAVRIFLEFERQEAAIKAIVDLNGRYFGGRMVKATFYNLDKFRRLDLAGPVD